MDNQELFTVVDFPKFCCRLINYKGTCITDGNNKDVHNNKLAWKTFIENEKGRYEALNQANEDLHIDVQKLDAIDYQFVSPWMTRYDNATNENKVKILQLFVDVMYEKYFQSILVNYNKQHCTIPT